jgi:DNA-binding CsgD family transcriptional regulator
LDNSPEVLNYSYFPPEMCLEYTNNFAQHDLWARAALSKRFINRMFVGEAIVSPDEYASSIFYNEFFRRYGEDTFHCLGGAQATRAGTALIGVYRNRSDQPFADIETERLNSLVGHIRSALTLRGRLAAEHRLVTLGQAAWDATNLVSIVVRRDGRRLQHNEAAETVLRRADPFKAGGDVLQAAACGQQERLTRAIRLATAPVEPSGSSLRMETAAGVEYLVSITPISRRSGPSLALVLFKDPLAPQDTLQGQLQSAWGLTPHEAMVAAELAQGRAIAEIAERRDVLESTVKTQLKAISAKMDAHGQSELIAKMARLP